MVGHEKNRSVMDGRLASTPARIGVVGNRPRTPVGLRRQHVLELGGAVGVLRRPSLVAGLPDGAAWLYRI